MLIRINICLIDKILFFQFTYFNDIPSQKKFLKKFKNPSGIAEV